MPTQEIASDVSSGELSPVPAGIPVAVGMAAQLRGHTRWALKRSIPELRSLVKFTLVGCSGYALNIAVFALLQHELGLHYAVATTIAFLVAVVNNFHWNRRWTFRAVGIELIHRQARRFLIVSLLAFLFQFGLLHLFIGSGMPAIGAQALSVALATPFQLHWQPHVDLPRRRRSAWSLAAAQAPAGRGIGGPRPSG
jgi:putative flippase GtrA